MSALNKSDDEETFSTESASVGGFRSLGREVDLINNLYTERSLRQKNSVKRYCNCDCQWSLLVEFSLFFLFSGV